MLQNPVVSLLVLFLVILLSANQRLNMGIVAFVLAIIGVIFHGITFSEFMQGLPISLFIVLVGVSCFFGIAHVNGTLMKLTQYMILLTRGQRLLLPLFIFLLAFILSSLGAGNIGAVALLAPVAMSLAARLNLGGLFMAVMLVSGANAGTFSPFAFTGILANGLVSKLGLTMNPWTQIYLPALLTQSFIAFMSYLVFYFLLKRKSNLSQVSTEDILKKNTVEPLTMKQWTNVFAIVIFIISIIFFKMNVGLLAIVLAIILTLLLRINIKHIFSTIPWQIIILLCGVSTLVFVVDKVGGLEVLVTLLSKIAKLDNVTGILAFIVGIISTYASSSAVVLPTFIPLVPGLIEKMGGGDPAALISTINVASHVVDVSPLSTLGALCIANAALSENKTQLFRSLLIYGLSMTFFGAVVCYLFFGLLWGS